MTEPRKESLWVYVTQSEKEMIVDAARRVGLSVAAWMRNLALREVKKGQLPPTKVEGL